LLPFAGFPSTSCVAQGNGRAQAKEPRDGAVGGAWLFMAPDLVPQSWQHRAVPAVLVPLLPEEAERVLAEGRALSRLDPEDLALAHLVADGVPVRQIADRLHLAPRSVYRRLATLREEVGVHNMTELVAELARRGFGA